MKKTGKLLLIAVLLMIVGLGVFTVFAVFVDTSPERHPAKPKVTGIYGMTEAYINGWISKSDMKSIAYYYNDGQDYENYAKPKNPEVLDSKTEKKIKQWRDDIEISDYFGVYNGCVAILIEGESVIQDSIDGKIVGIKFRGYNKPVMIWVDSVG